MGIPWRLIAYRVCNQAGVGAWSHGAVTAAGLGDLPPAGGGAARRGGARPRPLFPVVPLQDGVRLGGTL